MAEDEEQDDYDTQEEGLEDILEDLGELSEDESEEPYEEVYEDVGEMEMEAVEVEEAESPKMGAVDLDVDASLEELPKTGAISGRFVDLVLILFAVIMIAFFFGAGLYTSVSKLYSLEMGMLLNLGIIGVVVIVLLWIKVSLNIEAGDALARKDTTEAYRAAVEKYDAALKIDRRAKKAWTCKGLAMRMASHDEANLRDALKCHNMALKIDPDYGVAWVNKGNVLFNLGHSSEALKCYDKAIDLDPDYTVAWVNKGEMLVKMGNRKEAQKCLDRARSLAD